MKKRIITKREVEEDSSGKKLYEQIEENTDDLSGEASSVITRKLNRCQNCGTPLKNSQSIRGRCAFCPTEVCDACAVTCVCNKLLCSAHSGSVLIQNKPSACCPDCKEALEKALAERGIKLDYVVEIVLERDVSKKRIMGRRLCPRDNNHPNNIGIEAISPVMKDGQLCCRVCGANNLVTRPDDQDETAIDKRHDIYYDTATGTMAAINYFRAGQRVIEVDGRPSVNEVFGILRF
ncbi:MAG: Adenylate kinase [Parcubacteria group bacterium GW2011_GWF2_50_9]|nr:MAG: Adenylate kinase [Parcubacteria group bacterium GW2011_GWF2_50_9]